MTKKIVKTIALNKKARRNYTISDKYEAGISLVGSEVKSIRASAVSFKDAYVEITDGHMFLKNLHIAAYSHANLQNHPPERKRKLLMHKREILRMAGKINERGFSLIPLRLYFKGSLVKLELGLAKGKENYGAGI